MFIPLSLGSHLKRFPWVIFGLVLTLCYTSYAYFPVTKNVQEGVRAIHPSMAQLRSKTQGRTLPGEDERKAIQSSSKKIFASSGFLTSESVSLSSLLVSTLTHVNWGHLLGNLLILFFLGVWVEQKMGPFRTLGMFFFGSFVGLSLQVAVHDGTAVIGASAGVYALMGAFFVFFRRSQICFLYSLIFFNRRIYLPVFWIFPILYFSNDIVGALADQGGVAHIAHLGGLALGLAIGLVHEGSEHLGPGELFAEEKALVNELLTTTKSKKFWSSFKAIMSWNCQNFQALEICLSRGEFLYPILEASPEEKSWFEDRLRFKTKMIFKREDLVPMHAWLERLPPMVSIHRCLQDVPTSLLLQLADSRAESASWDLASRLYQISLKRRLDPGTRAHVESAIQEINHITKEIENERSLQTAA